jgi:hypothetical protein
VANIEKHPKPAVEQVDQADFSEVPTCARASHLVGQYIKNRHNGDSRHVARLEGRTRAAILRIGDLPATPHNLERMQERIKRLNRQLADSGVPFRLRVV